MKKKKTSSTPYAVGEEEQLSAEHTEAQGKSIDSEGKVYLFLSRSPLIASSDAELPRYEQ